MRKLFKIVKRCQRDMEDIADQVSTIEKQPYYEIYGTEAEREKDLQSCYEATKSTLKEYDAALENLEVEIAKERQRISSAQRKYNLINATQ